jgi:hypothetical protein
LSYPQVTVTSSSFFRRAAAVTWSPQNCWVLRSAWSPLRIDCGLHADDHYFRRQRGRSHFSFLPISTHGFKLALEFGLIFFLIYLNLRGTEESVLFLLPIFLLFVIAHIFAIGLGILPKAAEVPLVASTNYQKIIGDFKAWVCWRLYYRSARL